MVKSYRTPSQDREVLVHEAGVQSVVITLKVTPLHTDGPCGGIWKS
jgi:hypothetical protein